MDQPQREDSGGLADAVDRERLGRLVASRYPPQATSEIHDRGISKWLSLPLILTGGFLVLVASGLLLFFWIRLGVSPPMPTRAPSLPNLPMTEHTMVAIPGGTFKMGRDDGTPAERPGHSVAVENFFLDVTEVTKGEYADFVKGTNHPAPPDWPHGDINPGQEQLPVTNVSFEDAQAFASWRSKRDGVAYRLPTEEEWEYAARNGGLETLYPWGNEWLENHAATGLNGPLPVGSFPDGRNRWGVYDLIGNVWEWTSSKASLYSGSPGNGGIPPATRDWVVARGGSFASDPNNKQLPISSTYRDWFLPTLKHKAIGFRLARSGY